MAGVFMQSANTAASGNQYMKILMEYLERYIDVVVRKFKWIPERCVVVVMKFICSHSTNVEEWRGHYTAQRAEQGNLVASEVVFFFDKQELLQKV